MRHHRFRRCVSTNTASNSPSTKASLIATEFNAEKRQNLKPQKLCASLCPDTRHTGVKRESGFTDALITAKQRQYMPPLPTEEGAKPNGETFYADPDAVHNQLCTGNRVEYQAYKRVQRLASRQNPALNVHPDPHGSWSTSLMDWTPALLIRSMT